MRITHMWFRRSEKNSSCIFVFCKNAFMTSAYTAPSGKTAASAVYLEVVSLRLPGKAENNHDKSQLKQYADWESNPGQKVSEARCLYTRLRPLIGKHVMACYEFKKVDFLEQRLYTVNPSVEFLKMFICTLVFSPRVYHPQFFSSNLVVDPLSKLYS
jgi:hypothetical protein